MMNKEFPKIGIVMEGGALRGLFTAGVLDVFLEHNLHFGAAVGVSAGAAFGCNLKSRQPGRVLRYNLNYCKDPRYCSFRSLLKTGDLFGAEFCYKTLPEQLDPFAYRTFDADPMEFFVVCTDTQTGEAVYPRCDRVSERTYAWMRASASMPLASRPVEIDGRYYLDGGISDPIPLQFFLDRGFEKNIVVLTQPRDYVKPQNKLMPLMRRRLKAYPELIRAMETRHLRYAESRDLVFQQEELGAAVVICPAEPLPIGRLTHDPEKIRAAYACGRQAALQALPAVRKLLGYDTQTGEAKP